MRSGLCYYCGSPATGDEHVPPKCIFPKSKDIASKEDYRRNLIKVPSCDLHNLLKSKDDENLFLVLSLNCDNNLIGQGQATTKLVRALQRSRGLKAALLRELQERLIYDQESRLILSTAAINIDRPRLIRCFEHIGKGLYYHQSGVPSRGEIKVYIMFLVDSGHDLLGEISHPQRGLRRASCKMFSGRERIGANPKVFYYQYCQGSAAELPVMRLVFYEGSCVTLIFR
jgi:hypothetical protein